MTESLGSGSLGTSSGGSTPPTPPIIIPNTSNTSLPSKIQVLIDGYSAINVGHEEEPDLEISYVSPGGWDTATFKLCDEGPPDLTRHVVIRDLSKQKTIYAGRVSSVRLGKDGYEVTCKAQSVWTTDRRVKDYVHGFGDEASFQFPSGTPVTNIIREMLNLCPDIYDSGHIIDSSLQLFEASPDMSGWTFADVMSWAMGLTSLLGTPITWHVFGCGMNDYGCLYVNFEDTSARLQVQYNDTFESTYDDQLFRNTYTIKWGNGQVFTIPPAGGIQYDTIKCIRDGYVAAGNDVRLFNGAKALAYAHLSRAGEWRSTSDSMTIDCNSDEEVVCRGGGILTPEITYPQALDPWMVPIGYGTVIENIPKKWGRYATPNVKFLTSRRYSFKAGTLELGFGMPKGFDEEIRLINAFEVNRPTVVVEATGGAAPLVNQDTTSVFGPSFSETTVKDPSLTTGIPIMATQGEVDGEKPVNKGVIHPNIIADEGLEANVTVPDLAHTGFKTAIRVIPGVFNEIEVLLMDDDGLVADTCFIKLYKLPKGTSTVMEEIAQLKLTQKRTLIKLYPTVSPKEITLESRAWILPEVKTAAVKALTAAVSLHAKRDYPDLKLK